MYPYDQSNVEAIKDCSELIKRYPLEECLRQCKALCDALDSPDGYCHELTKGNPCMKEIYRMAIIKYGARNIYAALLYLDGNTLGCELHLQIYRQQIKSCFDNL